MKRDELERLRALLREADPAAGVDGPSPEVSSRLRRRALAALAARPERGAAGPWARAPRWAFAAAAALLLAAGLAFLLRPRESGVAPRPVADLSRVAAASPAARPSAGVAPGREVTAERAPGAPAATTPPVSRPRPAPPAADRGTVPRLPRRPSPDAAAAVAAASAGRPAAGPGAPAGEAAETAAGAGEPAATATVAALPAPLDRQIQLTAPGGTRIVWILTSGAGP